MTTRRWVAAALLALLAAPPARADDPVAAGACGFGPGGGFGAGETVRVAAVTDDLELRLADNRAVLLAGIDAPHALTPSGAGPAGDARESLGRWLAGRDVTLKPLAAEPDRWNRTVALVFAPVGAAAVGAAGTAEPGVNAAPLSVAEALVDAGLARARPDPAIHNCWPGLLALERQARAQNLGLWSEQGFAVLDADDAAGLAGATGGMAIVEGVVRVRAERARLRLLFGRGRFAATLARRAVKVFSRAGLDPETFAGRRLRVRGFLDDRFGPRIDVIDLDQIEFVAPAATPAPPGIGNPEPARPSKR